jgi:CBS domain-containing protein/anti-sigma regulatory factor (Ser/Thr protein kinase)
MEIQFDKTLEILFELKVGDAMKKELKTISPDESMSKLNEVMSTLRLSGMPVVEGDSLAGIISISDIISWLMEGGKDVKVKDKMIKNPNCLYSDQPLIHAIKRFDELGYNRFPVLERESGKLVGIITKGDVIRGTLDKLQHDYSEEEIRQYRASHFFEDISADFIDLSLTFNIKGKDFNQAGSASTRIKKNLKRLGIQPEIIRRASIAVYEAETNVIIFTGGGTMKVNINNNQITITVKDKGPGIENIDSAMKEGYSTADPDIKKLGFGAGMGFANMKKCSDTLDVQSKQGNGTLIKMEIYLNSEEKEKSAD